MDDPPLADPVADPFLARGAVRRGNDSRSSLDPRDSSNERDASGDASSSAGHDHDCGHLYDRDCDLFKSPAVRDLAWLMLSPSLLSRDVFGPRLADPFDAHCFGADARARTIALLHELDANPTAFAETLLAGREQRLGRYAERLLAAWLSRASGIEVQALSLPVRDGGLTLGECDALFRTAAGCREHWELAVKFYLFVDGQADRADVPSSDPEHGAQGVQGVQGIVSRRPPAAALRMQTQQTQQTQDDRLDGCEAYVGAGLADRLDWKLGRLLDHQLPLSGHPGLVALAPGPWQARMYVKGRLFYPLEQWQDGTHDASALAADHPRGWWATLDTWLAISATSSCRWAALDRLDWLAPLRVDARQTFDRQAFAEYLSPRFDAITDMSSDMSTDAAAETATNATRGTTTDSLRYVRPVQVAALQPDGWSDGMSVRGSNTSGTAATSVEAAAKGSFRELSRGFIVPNNWPERAARFRPAQAR